MQRTDEREREPEIDVASGPDRDAGDAAESRRWNINGRLRERLRPSLPDVFSPRAFLVALVLVGGGWLAASVVLTLGALGGLLGVSAAAFALGLAGRRVSLEVALAGAMVAGASAVLDHLVLSVFVGLAAPVGVLGAGSGALAAAVGHYLGRDLRDGLTRDL